MNVKLLNKIVKMSKYTLFGLFMQCLLFSVILANDGYGQESQLKDIHLSFNLKNATIEDAFVKIESLTTFKFAYKKSAIKKYTQISNDFENQPLDEILLLLTQEGEISFKRINQTIYVTKTKKGETQGLKVEESVFQERTITGKVTSVEDEGGMPGVNVVVKGTSIGSITDVNGQYSLEVPANAVMVFSSVGYVPQEIEVGNQSIIDVVLAVDVTALDEIVVIGYGTQKKANLTGAVSTVNSDVIENRPLTSVATALQGTATGVFINQNSGQPGRDDVMIRIPRISQLVIFNFKDNTL